MAAVGPGIGGRYIVRLANEASASGAAIFAKVRAVRGTLVTPLVGDAFRGFAAELSAEAVARLRDDPDVVGVEPDQVIRAAVDTTTDSTGTPPVDSTAGTTVDTTSDARLVASWGLDRMDQRELPLTGSYEAGATGAGVTVYVFDTGIAFDHAEFGGRAAPGMDYVTPGGSGADCNGHGTHVAGIIGGATYGVAPEVALVSVRVLDCTMHGSMASAINGLNWVVARKRAHPETPMVANLSFDGAKGSASLDQAVNAAIKAGVTVVVAAGNTGGDACAGSPARVPGALTVAASTATDELASYSNRGACVDLAAPGSGILSAWIGAPTAAVVMSGTSMAAPHVSGAVALALSVAPTVRPADAAAALVGNATVGALRNLPAGTADRLLYTGFLRAAR
jgi:subtilisin family serine protease